MLIFYFVLIFGIIFLGAGIWVNALGKASRTWPTTTGKINESEVKEVIWDRVKGPDTRHYQPVVKYSYLVQDRQYESDTISASGHLKLTPEQAQKVISQVSAGGEVKVWYNPRNPAQSYLITGAMPGTVPLLIIGGALIVAGVTGILW